MAKIIQSQTLFSTSLPIIDVRSPSEFQHAHIPGAINSPLFSDEERKIVGITYKQQGKIPAIEKGLSLLNLPKLLETIKSHQLPKQVIIYCARGGMRSSSMSWLFDLLQYDVFTLEKGYKSFRNWTLNQFKISYPLVVIGGETGSGKTKILQQLKQLNEEIIDLEDLAHHKGSVFGGFKEQPTQEQFENTLALALAKAMEKSREMPLKKIFIEDESLRIGKIQIPQDFFFQMRKAPVFVLKIPQNFRIQACIDDYQSLGKEKIALSIKRLERRLGGLATQKALLFLENNQWQECCQILISYYDKKYQYGLSKREKNTLIPVNKNLLEDQNFSPSFFAKKIQEQAVSLKS